MNRDGSRPSSIFPPVREPFRLSRIALGLILASILLAVILAISTVQSIQRGRVQMEAFLQQKGMVIIRSIEAGTRTAMRHPRLEDDTFPGLIAEYSSEKGVAFILIQREDGAVLASVGDDRAGVGAVPDVRSRLPGRDTPLVTYDPDAGVLMVSRLFAPLPPRMPFRGRMHGSWEPWRDEMERQGAAVITVGLLTREFDAARRQDVRHFLVMGAILFLAGVAGFYFLFLYQGMRVARTTLANMELYTARVIESMPAGLITLDAEHRVAACNRRVEELLGSEEAALQGRAIGSLLPQCLPLLEEGAVEREAALEYSGASGRAWPLNVSASPLLDGDGRVLGTVLVLRDMRQIREMEQQLERNRRMAALGKMAAGIAHEVRNPLGTLRGFAQYFGNRAEDDQGRQYAALMVSEVDRLNQNVSGLLQFARPREPQFDRVDLDALLDRAATMMQADLQSHGVRLHREAATGILFQADGDLLLQVLLNLVRNALAATPAGGVIALAAEQGAGAVRITVRDNGCGMSKEEQERMFDPFFTTRKEGTGLGLAVSYQIVEQHGGTFEVTSAPGAGTAVTVVLPERRP